MKIFVLVCIGIISIFGPHQLNASDVTDVRDRIDNVLASTSGTPSAPIGMDQKGFIGTIVGRIFETTGMIKTSFLIPFQTILNGYQNTLPRWNGQSFVSGTVRDSGTGVSIGGAIDSSYTLSVYGTTNLRGNTRVAGDLNFTGDLYKNGVLFTPALPNDIVRTFGNQTVGGVKTFTSNIVAGNRTLYFGNSQYLYGNNGTALTYKSNHDTATQIALLDRNDIRYGSIYGGSTGEEFGLLDGDGNWSYRALKDTSTQFRINDSTVMTLSGANVGIGLTPSIYKLDVNGTITSREANALRMRQSRYSVIHRNDNANYWILLTDSGSTDASYNGLRPLKINLATGDVNLDGDTLALDATNNYIGIGVARPTDELDVNGKIRMRVQTQATDTPDTVATKKYVDDKMVREEDRLTGYREVPINLDEDEYGNAITGSRFGGGSYSHTRWQSESDTCNNDKNNIYTCPANTSKTCRDLYVTTSTRSCGDGDTCTDTYYNSRPIICIKSLHLIRTEEGAEGIKVSNTGTATIVGRDYSGWKESCRVNINIAASGGNPACQEEHTFRLGSQGSDGECESAVEAAIKSEGVCTNFKGVKSVNWNRSGDTGGVRIEYFGF